MCRRRPFVSPRALTGFLRGSTELLLRARTDGAGTEVRLRVHP